jgi:hypothetical protein
MITRRIFLEGALAGPALAGTASRAGLRAWRRRPAMQVAICPSTRSSTSAGWLFLPNAQKGKISRSLG